MTSSQNYSMNLKSHLQAFTLIELLVVIAIIAILMGLLFPAAQNAINSAKKTTAKNQAVQIATAITAYEAEYGRLPNPSSGAITNAGPALVAMLCTTNDTTNNPRAIVFLDSAAWKNGKGGTNATGYCDPWTNVYSVALDTDYTNGLQLPVQTNSGGAITTNTVTKHIGVWTVWTNGSATYLMDSWD